LVNHDPAPQKERLQSQKQLEKYEDTTKCILCACCTTACPSFWADPNYVGPAAIVQAHRFVFDSRDQGTDQRLDVLGDREGVWRCRTIFNCVDACPRGIDVTKAIGQVKKELLFRKV
jgi:succinate dehydrogenase / fumarate reductase iron-sulfur subunit